MTLVTRPARRFLAALAIIAAVSRPSFAQLSGTYTIGGTSPDYPTFSAAVNALTSNGVSGPVDFLVRAGTYNEQISIGAVTGASSTNLITFESDGGNRDGVVLTFNTTTSTANYVLRLGNAAHVRFLNMTFASIPSGSAGGVVCLEGVVSDVAFAGNAFHGYASPYSGTAFALLYAVDATLSGVLVYNNRFSDCSIAISLRGPSTAHGLDVFIVNNLINNPNGYGGILLNRQDAPSVFANLIYAGDVGVELDDCDYQLRVSANIIEAKRQGVVIYSCGNIGTTPGAVDDNFIHVTGTGYVEGIRVQLSEEQDIIFNSVNLTGASSVGTALDFIQGSAHSIEVADNILVNTGGGYLYSVTTDAAIGISDYNDMVTTGPYIASWASTDVATVSALQSLTGRDPHSITREVHFVSDLDLHLTGASLGDFALRGMAIDTALTDIDGEHRGDPYPYMGADEVIASPLAVREKGSELPANWQLGQNYPNPFNPSTTIIYSVGGDRNQGLGGSAMVRLSVYDLLGREVAVLVNGLQTAGRHEIRFDATGLASGAYVYRLQSGNVSLCKAMVLVR